MSNLISQDFDPLFPIADLKPFPGNPNRGRTDLIEESIGRVGFYGAVLVQKSSGHILAGHHRVQAATAQGITKVPVLTIDVSDEEAKRIVVGDNRIGRLGYDDEDALQGMLQALMADTGTLVGTGYDEDALAGLVARGDDPEVVPDADPIEPPEKPVTKLGDVIRLGDHRLVCGDATDDRVYDALLGVDGRAQLLITDPPYNVDYVGGTADQLTIINDHMSDDDFASLLLDSFTNALRRTVQGGPAYVFHADSWGLTFRAAFVQAGWDLKQVLVWAKQTFALGRQDYQWQHEPILYGWRPGAAHRWFGGFDKATLLEEGALLDPSKLSEGELRRVVQAMLEQSTVLREDKPRRSELHPTMKPVPLIARLMSNSSRPGDVVIDPFGGSGTTLIAAQGLGRQARLVELDPAYCDVIVRRWEDVTEETAVRE